MTVGNLTKNAISLFVRKSVGKQSFKKKNLFVRWQEIISHLFSLFVLPVEFASFSNVHFFYIRPFRFKHVLLIWSRVLFNFEYINDIKMYSGQFLVDITDLFIIFKAYTMTNHLRQENVFVRERSSKMY